MLDNVIHFNCKKSLEVKMIKTLFSETQMLLNALKNGYAIGAYNFSSVEDMRAIINGCENSDSPLILALSEKGLRFASAEYLVDVVKAATRESSIPISLHLDHGKNFDIVKEVIDLGFNSVMIDGSALSYEDNIAITKKVVDYAHKKGVDVEAELGTLAGIEDDVKAEKNIYTDPEQAYDFVKKTNVDSLAIAIGTSHGAYKFKGEAKLRFDILNQVSSLMPDLPIVLHGASSVPQKYIDKINKYGGDIQKAKGVPEKMLVEAGKLAVCKINCDTDIRMCYTASMREFLANNPSDFTPRNYLQYCKDEVTKMIEERNRNVMCSAGWGSKCKK